MNKNYAKRRGGKIYLFKEFLKGIPNTEAGEFTAADSMPLFFGLGPLPFKIGKFCPVAPNVCFVVSNMHNMHNISMCAFDQFPYEFPEAHLLGPYVYSKQKNAGITIGNDVWIGYGATIISGAEIGDGSVIGANSTIAGNIPPYSIVAGNPPTEIRKRFSEDEINKLLELTWWDWSIKEINKYLPVICSENIDKLYEIWNQEIRK